MLNEVHMFIILLVIDNNVYIIHYIKYECLRMIASIKKYVYSKVYFIISTDIVMFFVHLDGFLVMWPNKLHKTFWTEVKNANCADSLDD